MLLLAKTFQGLGNMDMYNKLLEQIKNDYHGTAFELEAMKMIAQI
jgi:hypothetical protein